MKKSIPTWQMVGFICTGVIGTLLHFVLDWTGEHPVAGLFSAVNESIWEHTKLLFYPMVLFALVEYFAWGKACGRFWLAKLFGTLLGIVLIPVIYYTYTGILGQSADWFNIGIFFIVAAAVYFAETKLFQKIASCVKISRFAWLLFCVLAVVYTVLTFYPPRIPLFQDPNTGTYGYFKVVDGSGAMP